MEAGGGSWKEIEEDGSRQRQWEAEGGRGRQREAEGGSWRDAEAPRLHGRDTLAPVALLHADVDEILLLIVGLRIGKGVGATARHGTRVRERVCGSSKGAC